MQTLFILLLLGCSIQRVLLDDFIDPFDITFDDNKPKDPAEKYIPPKEHTTTTAATPSSSPHGDISATLKDAKVDVTLEKCQSDVGIILFRNLAQSLLNHLDGKLPEASAQEYNMLIKLSDDDVKTLQRFVKEQKGSPHDVHEILKSMTQSIKKSNINQLGKMSLWFEEKFGTSIDAVLKILLLLILISLFTMLEMRSHISWKQRFMKLVIISFIFSVPMTWYELYKAAEIQQQTTAMKDAPPDCVSKDGVEKNWLEAATGMLSSLVTFKEDNCQKYYEHMVIDPFIKVPPTKAVGITFVRFFVSPLKDVGSALSQFIRELLIDLPLTLYPVAIVMVSLFLFLLLFMLFGYSIRLPFFLSIEPTPYQAVAASDTQNHQALEENGKLMLEQMKVIQEDMGAQRDQIMDRMNSLEKLQKTAIEFTAATATTDYQPPTLPAANKKIESHLSITDRRDHIGQGDQSFEDSFESTSIKSPIPCSDTSEPEETSVKVETAASLTGNVSPSKQSPTTNRSSKLPVSMQRSKSQEKQIPQPSSVANKQSPPDRITHPTTETIKPQSGRK